MKYFIVDELHCITCNTADIFLKGIVALSFKGNVEKW